ncbi:MAG: hypothetical protein NT116_05660 [Candidatus Parcubacteria bacterium]|nr:hypothetical protein [Candidatus Parcubacteria bacterium]
MKENKSLKILVVDDVQLYVESVICQLQESGLNASGIVPSSWCIMLPNGDPLTEEDVLALVRDADVIFLDHSMPKMNGEEILAYWKEKGVDFSNKRVVGSSSGSQPYLKEQFKNLESVDCVKRFLGL